MRPLKREPSSLTVMQTSSAAREAASPTISPSGRRNNDILSRHQNRGRNLPRLSRARTAIRPSTAGPRKELRAGDHQDERAFTKPRCKTSCGVKGWFGDHPSARRGRRRQLKIISSYQKIQPSNQQHIHEHSSNAANAYATNWQQSCRPYGGYIAYHHQENKHHPKRTAGINTPDIIRGIGADDKGCQQRERKDGRGSTKGAGTYFFRRNARDQRVQKHQIVSAIATERVC